MARSRINQFPPLCCSALDNARPLSRDFVPPLLAACLRLRGLATIEYCRILRFLRGEENRDKKGYSLYEKEGVICNKRDTFTYIGKMYLKVGKV